MTEPTADQLALAERLVDLTNDAWSLSARVVDQRGIRARFHVHPETCDEMVRNEIPLNGMPVVTFPPLARDGAPAMPVMHLLGIEVHADPVMPEWSVALVIVLDK